MSWLLCDRFYTEKVHIKFIMKKLLSPVLYIIFGIFLWIVLFPNSEDWNVKLMYGKTGLLKNCRAIITANMYAYKNNEFSAEDTLESIDRNCGQFWYSWEIKH